MGSRTTASSRRSQDLRANACVSCKTTMKETRGALRRALYGGSNAVPSVPHLKCPKCGEVVLRRRDARMLEQGAISTYRPRHGLLSATDIRAIREDLDLTQADLSHLLRLGANTISRWETGRHVQNGAMDILLRLIRDLPGSVAYLRKRAA
ncbi:MAG TPA: type II TA system antitoxin MqsA family protein [Kofleriaceae bacterium]|nr:type II TA system antitoxin MqsA family protein [Kofleriaceae bacterium]